MSHRIPTVYIASSDLHGIGVFAGEDIAIDSIIEICPVILIPEKDIELIKKTSLNNYYFEWGENLKSGIIALGYGSVYNHNYSPNAVYTFDFESNSVYFYALREISAGEEITINYNGVPANKEKVWFDN